VQHATLPRCRSRAHPLRGTIVVVHSSSRFTRPGLAERARGPVFAMRLWMYLGWSLVAGLGCDSAAESCDTGVLSGIAAQAALLRIDVYADTVGCDAAPPPGSEPLFSRSFQRGEAIVFQLQPGSYVVRLSAFSDEQGATLLGSGCAVRSFAPGERSCLPLTVQEVSDGGVPIPPPDDLAGPRCSLLADCPATTPTCCTGVCTTTDGDPLHCGDCGRACSSANVATASCGSGLCTPVCAAGFADCTQPAFPAPDDGCESNRASDHQHPNGVGNHYFDCAPLGVPGNASTYTQTMCYEAINAWAATPEALPMTCSGGGSACLFKKANNSCGVWCYSGALAGRGFVNAGNTCYCPTGGSSVIFNWN
jgi:hypothetical protein